MQLPLVIVHLNVDVFPAVNPVTPLLNKAGAVIVAAKPPTTLHSPVPTPGLFPDSVKLLVLH